MTIYRATVIDTPDDPFAGGVLRCDQDAGLLVRQGQIVARGPFPDVRALHPHEEVRTLEGGMLIPGLVDTHVHYPQVRAIGGLGKPLLQWLEHTALPEEARLADSGHARTLAQEFIGSLLGVGTTSALVFGSHFPGAVDALFTEADHAGVRITTGLVVSDRLLRPDLLTTPESAYGESVSLAQRWHGRGRLRYAVTPRFSFSCSDAVLAACGAAFADIDGAFVTSHVNENPVEVSQVRQMFGGTSYVGTYDAHGLLSRRSVLAHNVHPTDAELATLAARNATVAHCPTSNAALGSGLFPLRRHLDAGVRVAMGSDVGAGTGFNLLKEGLQAYFMQQLQPDGVPLTPAHLLHLVTTAGADALALDGVGHLGEGMAFDAVWVRPPPLSSLAINLRHAADPDEALAKVFALSTPADVERVWVGGVDVTR